MIIFNLFSRCRRSFSIDPRTTARRRNSRRRSTLFNHNSTRIIVVEEFGLTSRVLARFRLFPSKMHIAETPLSSSSFAILYQPNTCRDAPYPCAKCKRSVISVPSLDNEAKCYGRKRISDPHDNSLALDALETVW